MNRKRGAVGACLLILASCGILAFLARDSWTAVLFLKKKEFYASNWSGATGHLSPLKGQLTRGWIQEWRFHNRHPVGLYYYYDNRRPAAASWYERGEYRSVFWAPDGTILQQYCEPSGELRSSPPWWDWKPPRSLTIHDWVLDEWDSLPTNSANVVSPKGG